MRLLMDSFQQGLGSSLHLRMCSGSCPGTTLGLRLSVTIPSKGKMPSGHFADNRSHSLHGWHCGNWA